MNGFSDEEKKLINQINNKQSERIVKMKCIDCGEEYEITLGKICIAHSIGLIVPSRCVLCKEVKDAKFKSYLDEDLKK